MEFSWAIGIYKREHDQVPGKFIYRDFLPLLERKMISCYHWSETDAWNMLTLKSSSRDY